MTGQEETGPIPANEAFGHLHKNTFWRIVLNLIADANTVFISVTGISWDAIDDGFTGKPFSSRAVGKRFLVFCVWLI